MESIWVIIIVLGIIAFLAGRELIKKKKSQKKAELPANIPQEIIEKEFDEMIDKFVKGELSKSFQSNLLLKEDERLIFDVPGTQLCEERSVKIGGGYQGFSVRIMKGVSYRFGGFSGGVEKKVVPIDSGNFILTNKRIVFSGEKRSVEIPLNKINTLEPLENGISLSRSGKSKMEYLIGTDKVEISLEMEPEENENWEKGTVEWRLTGEEIRLMIQRLIQQN